MSKLAITIAVVGAFAIGLGAAPVLAPAYAAGNDLPSSPPEPPKDTKAQPKDSKSGTKKEDKKSSVDDPAFIQGYKAAYATIYERNDFAAAIPQLKALGQDDRADVANLIGYSYRKLGNVDESKNWYERALKADPNHVKTWQYYGLWQVEQGNRDRAQFHLNKIGTLCGQTCPEYISLSEALARPPAAGGSAY